MEAKCCEPKLRVITENNGHFKKYINLFVELFDQKVSLVKDYYTTIYEHNLLLVVVGSSASLLCGNNWYQFFKNTYKLLAGSHFFGLIAVAAVVSILMMKRPNDRKFHPIGNKCSKISKNCKNFKQIRAIKIKID